MEEINHIKKEKHNLTENVTDKKAKMNRRDFLMGAGAGAVVAAVAVAGVAELTLPNTGGGGTNTVTKTVTSTTTTTVTGTGTTATPTLGKVVTLTINGTAQPIYVQNNWTLLRVLRDKLQLYAAKEGCDRGECGACSVIMDGMAVYSCQILAVEAEGRSITTLEGIGNSSNLHPLQAAWIKHQATECGGCAPGMIMTAKALLDSNPHPTLQQIREGLSGNHCVCGQYISIQDAVADVAGVSV
jgi:aerobic-type carbon monoxide dehydrogenase small subunit (CoxS/CutS family)